VILSAFFTALLEVVKAQANFRKKLTMLIGNIAG
jgi:hypothetical protein